MFPRWLWCNHVPAGLQLTPEQRAEVKQRVRALATTPRRYSPLSRRILIRLAPAATLLALAFAAWLYWLVTYRPSGGVFILLNLAGILLFQALLWAIIMWSINRAIAPLVWRALNEIGMRVCEECGYILHYGPEFAACPECGAHLARADPVPRHSSGGK